MRFNSEMRPGSKGEGVPELGKTKNEAKKCLRTRRHKDNTLR
eukprot:g3020.t1